MPRAYAPLHLHSHYSILDGATKIEDLLDIAAQNNMPAVAITDHGVMHGAIELYQKAKATSIRPIIGCEVYIIDGDTSDRVTKRHYDHMVLLAKNHAGYKNLVKLVSKAHLEGYYYKPRINWEQLSTYSEGLIALTACLSGPIAHPITRNNPEEAWNRARWLKNLFGDDFYLEIQDHGIQDEGKVNIEMVKISRELDIDLVVTNDSHYSQQTDSHMHDILLCMQTGKSFKDSDRMRFHGPSFYVKNGDELLKGFSYLDQELVRMGIDNTLKVAEKCNLELELDRTILPNYPLPEAVTAESYLQDLVYRHAVEKYPKITAEIEHRIRSELDVINHMGFPSYFLIVWDFINYAKRNGIPVGPGRGSAAGSIVAYSLGITGIDPVEHNLLFERFLNPERISMPDIDIDFCIERREEVIRYVANRYGQDRVAQIITFGTFAARAALKGVARVMDIPFSESDRLAKMIPSAPGTRLRDAIESGTELGKLYESDPNVRNLVDLALQIEGLNSNSGVHAAGVVISKDPLDEIVPLMMTKDGREEAMSREDKRRKSSRDKDGSGNEVEWWPVTQYAMDDVAKLGLLKMDFLGLRNLTIMNSTVKLVEKHKDTKLDMENLPLDDGNVYSMLSAGQTDGVFQLESGGMKALVKELKPTHFEDINALVALFRPGPLNSGMVEEFVSRKHGKSKVEYAHPDLEPILKDTYGTIVYQEQIMQIAQSLAGYTLGQADLLRRAMGKKKESEMIKQREIFLEGARKKELDERVASTLFDAMTEFAKYCFNRSHSAAYAMIAYQTAYLKAHFPVEYLSSLLSSVSSDLDKIQQYIITARKMGINVLPPDINKSDADFTPDGGDIRFGLATVKNIGEGVVERIIQVRSEKPFSSLDDFCERVGLRSINRRVLESLILVGAFDSFKVSRRQLYLNVDNLYSFAARITERQETGQVSIFASLSGAVDASAFQEKLILSGEEVEYSPKEIQSHEKELLGSYVSSHPLDDVLDKLPLVVTAFTKELKELSDGSPLIVGGLITSMVQKTTKTNKLLRICQLEDLTGTVECVAFSEAVSKYENLTEEGQKVVISGRLQFRGDDSISIVINSVRPLDDVRVLELQFKGLPRYEEVAHLREILKRAKGDDPVVLYWTDQSRMVVGPNLWVDSRRAHELLEPLIANGMSKILEFKGELTMGILSPAR